jgi:hypothetical protein
MKKLIFSILFLLSAHQAFNQKVFSVDYENQADLNICFVDYETRLDG